MKLRTVKIKKITKYIFLESKPQKADMVFIFGTRHKASLYKALELYKNKLVPKILVSGGLNKITGENEAEKMAKELINLGVKKDDIILENKSTNSLENVLFSKKVIEEQIGFKNISKMIIIVKHYHSRRTLMTLKKHFPMSVELLPITYEIYGFTKENWFEKNKGREKVLGEWNKIRRYLKRGDIEEL